METQEKSLIEKPALVDGELFGFELTERQAGVLPAAIQDARYFRDQAAEMVEFQDREIQKAVDDGAEDWRVAMRCERRERYAMEYHRAARLVAFLEKIAYGREG